MAQNNLKSVFEIFENKIYRIPDYQRGYAWGIGQLNDFWDDIVNLPPGKPHYTGVITLEEVNSDSSATWEEEQWILEKGFKAYFVVDGQQRLTTIILCIQAILESLSDDQELLHDGKDDIRQKYICQTKSSAILKAYLFGYEKDNPSYEFLKTRIFNDDSNSDQDVETLYTKNLLDAKRFFLEKLKHLQLKEVEDLYRKITMQLKFNIFEISDQVDVFIAFETMNNRGKRLSNLELLKNRLIYLTTILTLDEDKKGSNNLRNNINECWKTIYEFLGKRKDNPLDDDTFLQNHWIMYFEYTRDKANAYADFLLNEHFIARRVLSSELSGIDIQRYVTSLQKSVKQWFFLFNPDFSSGSEQAHVYWLRKLNRLRFGAFAPLAMAALQVCEKDQITKLMSEIERYIFVVFRLSQRRSNTGDSHFYRQALNLYYGKVGIDQIIKDIQDWTNYYTDLSAFKKFIEEKYRFEKNGYYGWSGLKYFLYEYEIELQRESKGEGKIVWTRFSKNPDTIEHIYPHASTAQCWEKDFGIYNSEQKNFLLNSLGNLLALSRSKNSSLKNDCFNDKKIQANGQRGYFNGSYSEIEVARNENWTPKEIHDRGVKMLDFLTRRWKLQISDKLKKELLFLDFINKVDSDSSNNDSKG